MLPHKTWNLDIDLYINPIIPPPPWRHLPYSVSRFFGHRRSRPAETGNLMPIFWSFIGVFSAILVLEAVIRRVPSFEARGVPIIVGSFVGLPTLFPLQQLTFQGAAAVLEFYAIESPLAQPRNAILGQFISASAGVIVARLFLLSDRFDDLQWVAGALACASATALMALTKTVHPPAGATALLAVVDEDLLNLSWYLLPVVLLSCVLMLAVALLLNNIERQFPSYWWTPVRLGRHSNLHRRVSSAAKGDTGKSSGGGDDGVLQSDSSTDVEANQPGPVTYSSGGEVIVRRGEVVVPAHMLITQEEELLLESMSNRI